MTRSSLRWYTVFPVLSCLLIGTVVPTAFVHLAQASSPPPGLITLANSVPAQVAKAQPLGHYQAPVGKNLTIELVLAINHQDQMNALMNALYNPKSSQYHHWLPTGEFDTRFGPTANQIYIAKRFLIGAGLTPISTSTSPFLLPAQGPPGKIEAAFHTILKNYRTSDGHAFFSNDTNLQIPVSLKSTVISILGLNDLTAAYPNIERSGIGRMNYGGGPRGTGLTPSQIAGIYKADPVYNLLNNSGQGITLAVFELSNYTPEDIRAYERQFNLRSVPLVDILVDGGAGADHSSADEVVMDIQLQIALAQGAKQILVYQSPRTYPSLVNQYFRIAEDNLADAISTSWGSCEITAQAAGVVQAENLAFIQMASQGQSIFGASGDAGAFDCGSAPQAPAVDDPAAQPYMTGVGGTSFAGTFDPGTDPHPTYPPLPAEHVWNNSLGSSGGGVSQVWASPDYQRDGPGVLEPGFSQFGAYCNQPAGVLCRQVPDISMNADPFSGYSIYCTDPGSISCVPGGFIQIAGTSAAAPLWSAIAALADNFYETRLGLFNCYVYKLALFKDYSQQFHDITVGNNRFYNAGPDYDMSTGIGTPSIYDLVTQFKRSF